MIPSLDQNPPIRGIPIIDMLPTNIAVAVIGILLAGHPYFPWTVRQSGHRMVVMMVIIMAVVGYFVVSMMHFVND